MTRRLASPAEADVRMLFGFIKDELYSIGCYGGGVDIVYFNVVRSVTDAYYKERHIIIALAQNSIRPHNGLLFTVHFADYDDRITFDLADPNWLQVVHNWLLSS